MRETQHPRSIAAATTCAVVIALATLATWPTTRAESPFPAQAMALASGATGSSSIAAARPMDATATSAAACAEDSASVAADATSIASHAPEVHDVPSGAARRGATGHERTATPSTSPAGATLASAGNPDGERRDPLQSARTLGTPGVYRSRVGGSWVNVPPPDRHYQGASADPVAPNGAG